jgi:hypothetical protein
VASRPDLRIRTATGKGQETRKHIKALEEAPKRYEISQKKLDGCMRAVFVPEKFSPEMERARGMNTRKVKKPIWVKPSFKDLPIFFEVCLYAGSR